MNFKILKDVAPQGEFRLYANELNDKYRREDVVYPTEWGDRYVVVTRLKNNKQMVIPETHYVFD